LPVVAAGGVVPVVAGGVVVPVVPDMLPVLEAGGVVGVTGLSVEPVVAAGVVPVSPSAGLLQPVIRTEIVRPATSRPISFFMFMYNLLSCEPNDLLKSLDSRRTIPLT